MEIETETREVTNTKTFVTLNAGTEDETEVEAARLIDFLEGIMGTDGFMTGAKHLDYHDKRIAEALEAAGLVGRSYSAGWHEVDEEAINELWENVMRVYYDDENPEEIDASMVR